MHIQGAQIDLGLDLSIKESVVMLMASSVPLDSTSLFEGVLACSTLKEPGFTIFWACFLVDLLALLKWKAFPDRIMDILGRLRHVSGEEIVKVCLLLCANTAEEESG